jgi:hypothetical protein
MENLLWLDDMDRRLRKKWLPPLYRTRVLRELHDHAVDILEHNPTIAPQTSADVEALLIQRLGDSEQVATSIIQSFQDRFFVGRHPILMFVLCPIPLGLLCAFLALGAVWLPMSICRWYRADVTSPVLALYVHAVCWLALRLLPVVIAVGYAWMSLRSATGKTGLLCSTLLLSLLYGCMDIQIHLPGAAGERGWICPFLSTHVDPVRLGILASAVCLFVWAKRTAFTQNKLV